MNYQTHLKYAQGPDGLTGRPGAQGLNGDKVSYIKKKLFVVIFKF